MLVVEVPGFWRLRVVTEQMIVARGWVRAASPVEADALLVCGVPGSELADIVEFVWDQVPGPRARADVPYIDALPAALGLIESALRNPHRGDRQSATTHHLPTTCADMSHTDMNHRSTQHGADHQAMGHEGMGHEGMGHEGMGHGGMGHGDMAPAGIPLAGGADDRDGLEMDVLEVPLGPVLPYWPPGLVLRCVLHGDVIADAVPVVLPETLPSVGLDVTSPALRAARHCDIATGVLVLAASRSIAATARRITADLVAQGDSASARSALEELQRRVSRSRLLRWSLRGLGQYASGDVHDRLLSTLRSAGRELDGHESATVAPTVDELPGLVCGLDLAAARLVVASLGFDTSTDREPAHG
ncbi:MAG: hypothetical protein HOV83_30985 [Catenulispora sp.]|nr:hypothetical protein [Catenulispora sp.]